MATETEYVERIRAQDNRGLETMLAAIGQGEPIDGWDPGRALEYVVLREFELE